MYSDMIENAAAVLSAKSGWNQEQSVDYIEGLIFNSKEDIPGLLTSIMNGSFEFYPEARIRRGKVKREKRDLWKAPRWVQETKILGITKQMLWDTFNGAKTPQTCIRCLCKRRISQRHLDDVNSNQVECRMSAENVTLLPSPEVADSVLKGVNSRKRNSLSGKFRH